MKEDNSNWSQGNENRPSNGRILPEPMDILERHPSIPKGKTTAEGRERQGQESEDRERASYGL